MRTHPEVTEFQRKHPLKVIASAPEALEKKMHDSVAWRAFHLYEAHGGGSGHEVEDWRQAESEVVRPMDCGLIVQDDRVCLTTDVSCFGPGTLEIWVEAHRITLCGTSTSPKLHRAAGPASANGPRDWIFRTHELSAEVVPAEVTVRFNGPAMHVYLRRALPVPQQAVMARAA
jgi:hypothetical protein